MPRERTRGLQTEGRSMAWAQSVVAVAFSMFTFLQAGVAEEMSNEARYAATLLAHFGYGAATGAIYGATEREVPAPALASCCSLSAEMSSETPRT